MPALRMSVGLVVNPWIRGLQASSRIDARSAPSAKIFTRNSEAASGIAEHGSLRGPQNPVRGLAQRPDLYVRPIGAPFAIAIIDKHRLASGSLPGFDVAPAIAHDEARLQIDVPAARRFEQEAGTRLAAGAAVGIVVRANLDVVELQELPQLSMNRVHLLARNSPASDIRLVGNENQRKSGFAQLAARFENAGQQPQFGQRRRRVRLAVADDGAVYHAVAIQKNGASHV